MASVAARAASREPSQAISARCGGKAADQPRGITSAGWPLSMNAASVSAMSSTTARFQVRLADHGEIVYRACRASRVGSLSSEPLSRTASSSTPCARRPRAASTERLGLGLGMRQVLAHDLGRQVMPDHAAQERLSDQVQRMTVRIESLRQDQRGLQRGGGRRQDWSR